MEFFTIGNKIVHVYLFCFIEHWWNFICSQISSNRLSGQIPEQLFQVSRYKYGFSFNSLYYLLVHINKHRSVLVCACVHGWAILLLVMLIDCYRLCSPLPSFLDRNQLKLKLLVSVLQRITWTVASILPTFVNLMMEVNVETITFWKYASYMHLVKHDCFSRL